MQLRSSIAMDYACAGAFTWDCRLQELSRTAVWRNSSDPAYYTCARTLTTGKLSDLQTTDCAIQGM